MSKFVGREFLEILPSDLDSYQKEECKIIISEYLNSNRDKRINVKNANQLYYIIDFLIEYISNKEKAIKDKINLDIDNKEGNINTQKNITFKEDNSNKNNLTKIYKDKIEIVENSNIPVLDLNSPSNKMSNTITSFASITSPSNSSSNSRKDSFKIK